MLGFDIDGEPLDLPSDATGWRVRRAPRRGHPATVPGYDGSPLVVAMAIDDRMLEANDLLTILGELGQDEPGRYRLDAVDERGKVCCSTPAYWTMPGAAGKANSEGMNLEKSLACALKSNEAIVKNVCDAMKTLSTNFAAAMDASARAAALRSDHGISLPSSVEVVRNGGDGDDEDKPRNVVDWTPLVEACAPVLAKLGELGALKAISAVSKSKDAA